MDEQRELENLVKLYKDETLHPVVMTMWDMWAIFEVCTLTLTHPNLPEYNRAYYDQMAKQFEKFILSEHPQMKDLAQACWTRGPDNPHFTMMTRPHTRFEPGMPSRFRRKTGRA